MMLRPLALSDRLPEGGAVFAADTVGRMLYVVEVPASEVEAIERRIALGVQDLIDFPASTCHGPIQSAETLD